MYKYENKGAYSPKKMSHLFDQLLYLSRLPILSSNPKYGIISISPKEKNVNVGFQTSV